MVNPNLPKTGMVNLTPQETSQEEPRISRLIDHDQEYQLALREASNYLDNPIGIISDDPQGASDKRFVRQNNFIIAYLMQLNKKLDLIQTKISLTIDSIVTQQASIQTSADLIFRQHETIQKLDNLLVLQTQHYQHSIQEVTNQLTRVLQIAAEKPSTSSREGPL